MFRPGPFVTSLSAMTALPPTSTQNSLGWGVSGLGKRPGEQALRVDEYLLLPPDGMFSVKGGMGEDQWRAFR